MWWQYLVVIAILAAGVTTVIGFIVRAFHEQPPCGSDACRDDRSAGTKKQR